MSRGMCEASEVECVFVDVNLELKVEVWGRDIKLSIISSWVTSRLSHENGTQFSPSLSASELS